MDSMDRSVFAVYEKDVKQLKLLFQDYITTYLHYGVPLSALLWDEKKLPWLYEHFTQIYCMDKEEYLWVDYLEGLNYIEDIGGFTFFDSATVGGIADIVGYIKDKIDNSYYVQVYVDEYYLPGRITYQREHGGVNTFFYGYDEEERTFSSMGFDDKGQFKLLKASYRDVETAFAECRKMYDHSPVWVRYYAATLLRVKTMDSVYKFNAGRFLGDLKCYLSSSGDPSMLRPETAEQYGTEASYGMAVYDRILLHLNNLLEGKNTMDFRCIHLLSQHKKLMHKKLEYTAHQLGLYDGIHEKLEAYRKISSRMKVLEMEYLMNVYTGDPFSIYGHDFRSMDVLKRFAEKFRLLTESERVVLGDITPTLMKNAE